MSNGLSTVNDNVVKVFDSISIVNDNIHSLRSDINNVKDSVEDVKGSVDYVESKVKTVEEAVIELKAELVAFIRRDTLAKNLQLAETKIINVRQEIERKFGHNKIVRKNTTGILQGIDAKIIRKDTIVSNAEEMMLNTPGYWLAPALVALSAWVDDNKELAERAVAEAVRRNDEKASLFFTLINRRYGRYEASEKWLNRYIEMQDPRLLPQDMIIVLDAYSNGLFGEGLANDCIKKINMWIEELSDETGFVENKTREWKDSFKDKIGYSDMSSYTYLNKYCDNFSELKKSMDDTTIHDNLLEYFKDILEGEIHSVKSVEAALDNLLDKLVSEFDTEELPLKRKEEELQCIIDAEGDKEEADINFCFKSSIYGEFIEFTRLLTNSVMHREKVSASKATQRLATALSKNWIIDGYKNKAAELKAQIPSIIKFAFKGWEGETKDGSDEIQVLRSFEDYCLKEETRELSKVKIKNTSYLKIAAAIGLPVIKLPLIIGSAVLGWSFYRDYKKVELQKKQIKDEYEDLRSDGERTIKAIMAEVTDYRREIEKENDKFNDTLQYLENIDPVHFSYNNYSSARKVL